jgi:DNA mismatch repair ATPase MutL
MFEKVDLSKATEAEKKEPSENSCRFCAVGTAKHKFIDASKKEAFYLCDKHAAEYNHEKDNTETNIAVAAGNKEKILAIKKQELTEKQAEVATLQAEVDAKEVKHEADLPAL